MDPIGFVQETVHTVKTKNSCSLILKLDLVKAFDHVNWSYIRLILIQIGVPLLVINWIMGCITSANFVVLSMGLPRSSSLLREVSGRAVPFHPCSLYW